MTDEQEATMAERTAKHDALVRKILPIIDDGTIEGSEASAALLECLAICLTTEADGDVEMISEFRTLAITALDQFLVITGETYAKMAPELCRTCSAWSELIARSNGDSNFGVEAICLKPDSPNRGRYMTGEQTCPAHTREPEFADHPSERAPMAMPKEF